MAVAVLGFFWEASKKELHYVLFDPRKHEEIIVITSMNLDMANYWDAIKEVYDEVHKLTSFYRVEYRVVLDASPASRVVRQPVPLRKAIEDLRHRNSTLAQQQRSVLTGRNVIKAWNSGLIDLGFKEDLAGSAN